MRSNMFKIRKRAKITNQYNQAPHLIQDKNGKVTNSQLDITNESQEVSPFQAVDHTASINRRAQKHSKDKTEITNDPQKKHRLGTVCKNILLLKPSNKYFTDCSKAVLIVWMFCVVCVCHAVLSVPCSLVVTCLERAWLFCV